MLYRLVVALITLSINAVAYGSVVLDFSGTADPVLTVETDASSGLQAIYVAPETTGLTISVRGEGAESAKWLRFTASGAAYAEQVGNGATLRDVAGNCGYAVETDGRRTYFWLADYSTAPAMPGELTVTDAGCDGTELTYTGTAPRMVAYAINGRPIEIDRGIKLTYMTLEESETGFVQKSIAEDMAYITGTVHAGAPLCATTFTLTADRFLSQWGREITVTSDRLTPVAVSAITSAEQQNRENLNEQTGDGTEGSFGGSAPCTMEFHAEVTDAAVFTEWQLATDVEFENITLRERATDFNYTFTEAGTYYVRFEAADASGACSFFSDTYTVSIGESRLRCPNAFSPGASEGVNDVWCVSYRSLTEFDCTIFNRWGVKIYHFDDPAGGWDGRYRGKLVPPGVYYYVIKARGADGVNYNLSGDINIIGSR